jgi:hypothetical protein
VKVLWALYEQAQEAADRLAKAVTAILPTLD